MRSATGSLQATFSGRNSSFSRSFLVAPYAVLELRERKPIRQKVLWRMRCSVPAALPQLRQRERPAIQILRRMWGYFR